MDYYTEESFNENKKIETKTYILPLNKEEYELTMNLWDSVIEIKLKPKNIIYSAYYEEDFNLKDINKCLFTTFQELKEAFDFYADAFEQKKVKLIKRGTIILYMKKIINSDKDKEVDTILELRQKNLPKEDLINVLISEVNELKSKENNKKEELIEKLINEVNELKMKINNKNDDSIDKLINDINNNMNRNINMKINELKNEIKRLSEENNELKISQEKKFDFLKKEFENEIIRLKEEHKLKIDELKKESNEIINQLKKLKKKKEKKIENKINSINDIFYKILKEQQLKIKEKLDIIEEEGDKEEEKEKKLNLELNDNINLNFIKCGKITNMKNIKRFFFYHNNYFKLVTVYKRIKNKETLYELAYPDNGILDGAEIIIYNILLKKTTNKIHKAHSKDILMIKHYYYSYSKKHLLLTSSLDKSIKLWNISSNPISNELIINNCFYGNCTNQFCILFNNNDYIIIGGSYDNKKNIWDKNGKLIGPIEKSKLVHGHHIETIYLNNESYILLSGKNHTESYDYYNNNLRIYKSNNDKYEHMISNLFNKNNIIYLICGDNGGNIIIFDFFSADEIYSISTGSCVKALCSLNEKYFLVGNDEGEIKVIDLDSKSIIKKYICDDCDIYGLEKIKIEEKGQFVISYGGNYIEIWK